MLTNASLYYALLLHMVWIRKCAQESTTSWTLQAKLIFILSKHSYKTKHTLWKKRSRTSLERNPIFCFVPVQPVRLLYSWHMTCQQVSDPILILMQTWVHLTAYPGVYNKERVIHGFCLNKVLVWRTWQRLLIGASVVHGKWLLVNFLITSELIMLLDDRLWQVFSLDCCSHSNARAPAATFNSIASIHFSMSKSNCHVNLYERACKP